jgi:hypothetical protein
MASLLIVVALTLAGQLGGANERYLGDATTQPTPTSSSPSSAPTSLAPLNHPTSPPANGSNRNATAVPSGNPYKSSQPSGFGNQQSVQPLNPNRSPANAGQSQPPPGYPAQSGFQANDSAISQQPPSKSAVMMQAMLMPPRDSQLHGESVRLVEVVSSGRTRNEQTQRIEAYWDLCSSVADYYLSLREQEELRGLTSGAAQQSAALQEFDKELAARSDTALRAARASQFRLAGFIGHSPNNPPLPADMPHCGTYTSRYEQVFAGRSSPEAQVLAQLLPMRYAELDDAAIGVTRDEEWLKGVIAHNENSDAAGNLRALELLALKRRAFVQIARDYNRRIARYSELATPGQISPERLTGMLIKRPSSSTATRSAAPAPPPTRQSGGIETSPPRTFADTEDWLPAEKTSTTGAAKRDSAIQPASATQSENHRERSVLVQPQ